MAKLSLSATVLQKQAVGYHSWLPFLYDQSASE